MLGLVAVAAGVSLYILDQQRMRFPWEESPLRLKAEFSTAQAVTAGQGQTVRVSGVRVGDIGEVELEDGKAVVEMDIDPEYEGLIRHDATRAAAAQDRPEGHVHRPRAGQRRRAGGQARASRSRSRRPRRTSTPTRSSPSSTPTRATT